VLFQTGTYTGNPMIVHKKLNERHPLTSDHFSEWLKLFKGTVDELFEGSNAALIKQRADSIAVVMKMKILY
jgi:hemoglobin